MPQAISYIRFSSAHQGKGSTTERQHTLISKWMESHPDVQLSPLSGVDEGRSGFSGEHLNHGLGKIIAAIEAGKIKAGDFILVEAVDRIGRLEPLDMLNLLQRIVATGVAIVTLEDNQTYSKESLNNNVGSLFILVGKIQQAHEYSKNLSRRLKGSWEARRNKARKGDTFKKTNAFWLTTEGKVKPREALIVRACINRYLSGRSAKRTISDLSKQYPELVGTHERTVWRWFRDRALIGEWSNKGDPIENAFEPVIETKVFYKLQAELARRAKSMSPEKKYTLAGLVVCGCCGNTCHFRTQRFDGYTIVYSNCGNFLKNGPDACSNRTTWQYELLLYIFESYIPEQLSSSIWDEQANQESERLEDLKGQRKEIDAQIDKLLDLLISMPDSSNVKAKLTGLNEKKDKLSAQITETEMFLVGASYNDHFNLDTIVDNANLDLEEYLTDPVAMREQLLKTDYRIRMAGKVVTVNVGPAGSERYEIVRRTTRHKCYILKHTVPEHQLLDESDDEWHTVPESVRYYALNRNGCLTSADSEDDLVERLEMIRQHERSNIEFEISEF
ncbi:recombinase family protein [Kushneria phyllosphaerae]|uniref:Resolvase/invertase-type recombinase catalytic domain-containing protein n=1 Tax=Kushneria phyllosphaerae TaxID=2100822 RepID=A0A2R8CIE4_9GAMM|nr:recombinase family protein [Kushneria phyllosphaerae]SPJ32688.1 hypothetical protein KSP9073_00689 [Kushneria phyllosphaerae]